MSIHEMDSPPILPRRQEEAPGQLWQNVAFSRTLIESSRDCIKTLSLDGRLLWISDTGQQMLCISDPAAIIGQSWIDFWEGKDREAARTAVAAAARGGTGRFVGHFPVCGEARWWDVVVSPMLDTNGEPEQLLAVSRDVTSARRTEQELARLNQALERQVAEFETLLEVLPIGIGIASDPECRNIRINPAFARVLGLRPTDNASKTAPDGERPTNFRCFAASGQEIPDTELPMQVAAREGKLVHGVEFDILHEDGVVVRLLEYAAPLFDRDGKPSGSVGAFVDITEQTRAEEALRESEARLRAMLQSASVGIALVDCGGRLLEVNPRFCRMLGYTAEELLTRTCEDLTHPGDWYCNQAMMGEVVHGVRSEFTIEKRYGRKDGSWLWVSVSVTPIRDQNDRVHRLLAVVEDIQARKEAEQALRESEARLSAILEQSPLGIGLVDRKGKWVVSNAMMRTLLPTTIPSRDPGQAVHWRAWREDGSVLEPEEWPGARALRGEVVSPGIEFLHTTEDGYEVWTRVAASPFRDADGVVTGAVCVVQDINAVKEAEVALRESEARFRILADTIPQLAWYAGPDGYITWYNRRWYEYTGTTPEQMEGWGWQCVHHPEVLPQVLERWKASIATGDPFDMIFPLKGGDGVFRAFLTRVMPLKDSAGRVVQWFGTNTDIAEQQAMQEAAVRRSEQLRRLADVAARLNAARDVDSAMALVTEEARNLIGAHQSVTGFTTDHNWSQAINSVSLSEKYAAWRSYDTQPDGSGIYAEVCRTNRPMRLTQAELLAHPLWRGFGPEAGKHPPLRGWLAAPLVGRDGRNMGLLQLSDKFEGEFTEDDEAVLVQLAQMASVAVENARLVEDLRAAGRAKDDFLAMLAHELRNPLSPMSTATHILKMRGQDDPGIGKQCEVLERQTRHLTRLLDDLLDVSRITRGKVTLKMEPLDLRETVKNALETCRNLLEERRHRVQLSLPHRRIQVSGDEVRLEQIATNLLNNAAKYTDPGGQVLVTLTEQEGEAVLSVRDTGQGISPELLPRVFDLFQQGERALDRSQGGLGIGLTLVKRLAELHGGSVEARSEGAGRGTEVLVRVPLMRTVEGLTPEAAGFPSTNDAMSTPHRRVMVVDDLADNREMLAELIRIWGYDVRTAADGAATLQLAGTYRPEVILLDIGMPGLDGYEVARRLRREPGLQSLCLIALTGYGQSEDVERARAVGFDHHLTKPVDADALEQLLSRVLTTG